MKESYIWKSDLAELIQAFLTEKRLCGFKFEPQERELRHFDEYYFQNGYKSVRITKPMVNNYIYESVFDRQSTYYLKERILHEFSGFLKSHGFMTYVVPIKSRNLKKSSYSPYIFSKEELKRFFTTVDSYPRTSYTNRNIIDPVLFRLLYGSGLRISEALSLQCKDYDFSSATLTLRKAKNNKDRLVPICNSLNEKIHTFYLTNHKFSNNLTILFNSPTGGKIDVSTAYCRFRDYLLKAGIPHTVNGPRMHDLRHTYAVHCLKHWVLSGEELTNALPYLSAYMGHTDFRATQYYLRLTADLYPDILAKVEAAFGDVIPEGCDQDERE